MTTQQKTGVITQDAQSRVTDIQKKPQQPQSDWTVHPFYIYRIEDIPLIFDCLAEGWKTDAQGNLVRLMLQKTSLMAWPMPGKRMDIGTVDCCE